MTLLLVLNLHGAINASGPVRQALEEMKVAKRFSASVVPNDASTMGALKLCKERVSWAPVEQELLTMLLKKRGMVSDTRILDSASLKKMGFADHEELAAKMVKDEMRLSSVAGLRPFFRLNSPKGGFKKSMRRGTAEGGLLGSNPNLAQLVGRML